MKNALQNLILELSQKETESEWLEFKRDNDDAQMIGSDISALANGAALAQHQNAYMIWGIDERTHTVVGTSFFPYSKTRGNQELLSWLHHMLSESAEFRFEETLIAGKKVVLLTIRPSQQFPIAFQKTPYIREGSYTKKLADCPSLGARLWDVLRNEAFETASIVRDLTADQVDDLLDIGVYFQKIGQKAPATNSDRFMHLEVEQFVKKQDNGLFSITNLGAILLAKDLSKFSSIRRKAVRVVQYEGSSRLKISRSKSFEEGYAVCSGNLFTYLDALLPSSEPIAATGERLVRRVYPPEAVRELVVNALVHQDLTSTGNSVVCEVFDDRLEITNPGALLIEKERIVDLPPRSRNALLASVFRRMRLCEELETGWDRVVELCEKAQLPAPEIVQNVGNSTRVIVYSHIDFRNLTKEQKLWSCYTHACILHLENKSATNTSMRERFGLGKSSSSAISRLLASAVEAKLLKPLDPSVGTKSVRYVPYWA